MRDDSGFLCSHGCYDACKYRAGEVSACHMTRLELTSERRPADCICDDPLQCGVICSAKIKTDDKPDQYEPVYQRRYIRPAEPGWVECSKEAYEASLKVPHLFEVQILYKRKDRNENN